MLFGTDWREIAILLCAGILTYLAIRELYLGFRLRHPKG